jgi:signal transduction histidine kinase
MTTSFRTVTIADVRRGHTWTMTSTDITLHDKPNRLPPARLALFIYAGLTGGFGAFLFLWGPLWLSIGVADPNIPFGQAALLRIAGAVLVTLAMSAMAIASSSDPAVLSRALNWFTAGHLVLWTVIAMQQYAVLGSRLASWVSWVAVLLLFGLAYAREGAAGSARNRGANGSSTAAKSRYDQAIRDVASQEERHRLARELHDSIKQQIFAIQAAAATAEVRLESDRTGVGEAIALVRTSAHEAMAEMEAMLDQLRAAPLDNAGLVAALRKQCDALGFRTAAAVTFTAGTLPPDVAIGPGVRLSILRIVQEALANIARHARAHTVAVSLTAANGGLNLSIADDGSGYDVRAEHSGMGLRNMKSRAEEAGGTLTVVTQPGAGTTIRVSIPSVTPAPARKDEKWKPWKSDILPWALVGVVGLVSRAALPATFVAVSMWTILRAWYEHRARRRVAA